VFRSANTGKASGTHIIDSATQPGIGFYLLVPGWYRPTDDVKMQLYRVSAFIPFVILGAGRRGLGIVRWPLVERMLISVILSAVLCAAMWQVLRVVDRRLRQN
jgi:hypothetical protein